MNTHLGNNTPANNSVDMDNSTNSAIPNVDNSEVVTAIIGSAKVQNILENLRRNALEKPATKEKTLQKNMPSVRQPTKRTAAEIKKILDEKKQDKIDRENAIQHEITDANKWLDKATTMKTNAINRFNKRVSELLISQSDTKIGKLAMIDMYQKKINEIQKDLDNNNYIDNVSEEFETALADAQFALDKSMSTIKLNYLDFANDKLNCKVNGIKDVTVNSKEEIIKKDGLMELQRKLDLEIENLERAYKEAKETNSPVSISAMNMINTIMEEDEEPHNLKDDADSDDDDDDMEEVSSKRNKRSKVTMS